MTTRSRLLIVLASVTWFGLLLCALAHAGPVETLEAGWNAKNAKQIAEIFADRVDWRGAKVSNEELKDHWETLIAASAPEEFEVVTALWAPPVWVAITVDQGVPGYMILVPDQNGRIASIYTGELNRAPGGLNGEAAQGADVVSTATILAMGGSELNPLMAGVLDAGGVPLLAAVKIGMVQGFKHQGDYTTCVDGVAGMTKFGWAATAANVGAIAGAGIGSIPAAVIGYLASDSMAWEGAQQGCLPETAKNFLKGVAAPDTQKRMLHIDELWASN